MRLTLTAILLAGLTIAARAEPITLTASPLSGFQNFSNATDFGRLSWRGGVQLASPEENFGGLSGLSLSADCTSLLAVSDTGKWLRAKINYDEKTLTGLSDAEYAPILDSAGNPSKSKVRADAEALAALGLGRYMVGFESQTRVGIYDIGKSGLKARFQLLKSPKAITEGPANGELESVGRISRGPWENYYLAISERNTGADSNIRGWLWQLSKTVPFAIEQFEDYEITDAVVLTNGDVLILERSFGQSYLPGMAIRRFKSSAIGSGSTVLPELIFSGRAPFYAIDNMEGLAICQRDGETRLTIISDNNLNTTLQRTLLLQFAYKP